MITIKAAFTDKDTMLGLLGRVGENGTRQIEFDCTEILTEYPAAVIVCVVKRPGEESAYYADMQAEGALRRLILRDVETEKPGTLKLELSALDGEKQRRTTLYAGAIASGLTRTDEEPSDPEKDLIDYIADAETVKQEASNAAKDALAAAGRAADAASEIENMTANAVTLAPGEPATANYNAGVLTIGVPKGEPGAKGDKGDKGDRGADGAPGKDGSDANVTAENIEAALGYTPVTPSDLAAKQDVLTDADKQSITKIGMTTGTAWTADEQAAARERMGIPGDYELIEEITLEEDVAAVYRRYEPDGTPYHFSKFCIIAEINILDTETSYYLRISASSSKNSNLFLQYFYRYDNNDKRININYESLSSNVFRLSSELNDKSTILFTKGSVSVRHLDYGGSSITDTIINSFLINNITICAGSKILIYGVRA